MFQMFALRDCKHEIPYIMHKKLQASEKVRYRICSVSAPHVMVNDNDRTMIGKAWMDTLRTFCTNDHLSEAYYQNQNLAERRDDNPKTAILK